MAFLLIAIPYGAALAVVTFVLAAATDSLDGYFARRRRQVTVLGAFLDPLADKLLVTAALLALIQLDKLSAWVAMVIISRELAVSGLRMVAAAENVVIPASVWGKVKTAAQMAAIVFLIVDPGWRIGAVGASDVLLAVAVVLTVASGADYFVRARGRLRAPGGLPE
jgi:CDP-diacylglycerol--glycerol-3-phosphate 3-phosphatidyltransferase